MSHLVDSLRAGCWRVLPVVCGKGSHISRRLSASVHDAAHISRLESRALVRVAGDDSISLLQGIITHDVVDCFSQRHPTIYAHFLNVQGRIMCDALVHRPSSELSHYLVECDLNMKDELIAHIKKYRLRKKVAVDDVSSEYDVLSVRGIDGLLTDSSNVVVQSIDPRVRDLGLRVVVSSGLDDVTALHPSAAECDEIEYHELRCRLGVCEGVVDLPPGKCLPLESNLDYMNGVSFAKGCYLGQELTARTRFTGVTRKRIVPLEIVGGDWTVGTPFPAPESIILNSQGKSAGKLRSGIGRFGLGLLRLSFIDDSLVVHSDNGNSFDLKARQPRWWQDADGDFKK